MTKTIEVPRDVINYVSKVDVQVIEKEVEVPGEVIQIHKKKEIIQQKETTRYIDSAKEVVVAQTTIPSVIESDQHAQTAKLRKYVPYLVPVEVYLPSPSIVRSSGARPWRRPCRPSTSRTRSSTSRSGTSTPISTRRISLALQETTQWFYRPKLKLRDNA